MESSNFSNSLAPAYLHHAGESEKRWMGETFTYFLATGESTNGTFCLVDETAKKGETVPLHRHLEDVESFYLLEGEITFFIGGKAGVRAGANWFVHIPGGEVHGFRIESETARYLILTTPRHGEFYRAISFPAQADGSAPVEAITGEMIETAVRDYGIEFVGELPDAA